MAIVVSPADGTEKVRHIPGSQTTEDLGDLKEDVSYVVRVSALIGNREGSAVPLNIRIRKCRLSERSASNSPLPWLKLRVILLSLISGSQTSFERVGWFCLLVLPLV